MRENQISTLLSHDQESESYSHPRLVGEGGVHVQDFAATSDSWFLWSLTSLTLRIGSQCFRWSQADMTRIAKDDLALVEIHGPVG